MAIEKTQRLTIRFKPENLTKIKKQAELTNVSPSRYVREVALGDRSPGGFDQGQDYRLEQLLKALSKIGNNVNQMARVANQTGDISAVQVKDLRGDIGNVSAQIVRELQG